MADLVYVGKNAMNVTKSDVHIPYTKVIVVCGEEETQDGTVIKQYEAGNDTGLALEVQCPWGTQAMANNLLSVVQSKSYRPYTVTSALLDPAAEIGDAVNTNNVYGGLFSQETTFGHGFYSDYSAPEDEQMNHEYKYESQTERRITRENNETKALFRATTSEINAEVSKKVPKSGGAIATNSFGWRLLDDSFTLYSNGAPVFICTKDGLTVNGNGTFTGTITAKAGKIGTDSSAWNIGDKSIYNGRSSFDGLEEGTYIGTDGISIFKDYKTNFSVQRSTGRMTVMSGMTSVDDSFNTNGMYFGYDGIALGGGRFKVTPDGTITAKYGVIGSDKNAWNIGAKSIFNGTDSLTSTIQGTYVGIDGIRVYNTDKESFTFKKNGDIEIKKGMVSMSDTGNTSGFYFGNEGLVLGGGKLKLDRNGTLTAKQGVIGSDTSAWNIGTKSIYNGTNSISSTIQGAYIGIDGIRIYNNNTNNFTFQKNGTLAIMKGMTSFTDTANSSGYYIGNDGIALGGGRLTLKNDGTLTAKKGTIGSDSSAWNIGAKSIYNGTDSISSTTQGAYLGIDGIRIYNNDTNNFTFQKNGTLEIKKGMSSFSDTTNTSGYYIGGDGIALGGGNLTLNKDGTFTAKKGEIAGWTINSSTLYSTNTNYPAYPYSGMSSGSYAFFAGSGSTSDASGAYFSVTNKGVVTLTELWYWDVTNVGQQGYNPDDQSTWVWAKKQMYFGNTSGTDRGVAYKIAGNNQTIRSIDASTGKITLANGKAYTFSGATLTKLTASWGSSSNPDGSFNDWATYNIVATSTGATLHSDTLSIIEEGSNNRIKVSSDLFGTGESANKYITPDKIIGNSRNTGWNSARGVIRGSLPTSNVSIPDSNYTLKIPNENYDSGSYDCKISVASSVEDYTYSGASMKALNILLGDYIVYRKAITNLKESNIKSGVSILGVSGNYIGSISSWVWGAGDGYINVTALPQNQMKSVKVSVSGQNSITRGGDYTYGVEYENGDGDDMPTGATKTVTVAATAYDYYNTDSLNHRTGSARFWKKPTENSGVCTIPNVGNTAAETWFSMSSIGITQASWHSTMGTVKSGKLYYWDDDSEDYEPVVNSNKYWYYSDYSIGNKTIYY